MAPAAPINIQYRQCGLSLLTPDQRRTNETVNILPTSIL